jgi:tetratricopeptide (TPR) repeat protein
MTTDDLEKSLGFFTQAIALDANYAQAHAGLSQVYFYLGLFGTGPTGGLFPKAKASAMRALELDESVSAAHNALAAIHILYEWDWATAEAECMRAVQLNPNDSVTHFHLADYMSIQARHHEAIAEFKVALELDPLSRVYVGFFGMILYRARLYDESIAQCRKALELDPNYANALWFLALSLEQKGHLIESIAKLEQAVSLSRGSHFRALLARAHALAGELSKAQIILEELKTLSRREYVSPFDFAVIYAGLGDLDTSFQWFEEAYQQRVFRIIELTLPMFDDLRPDTRWQDLVRRIGLPQ